MHSNTFIFNVSRETYETHRKFGFCATGNSNEPLESLQDVLNGNIPYKHYDIISNILNVRDGDLIFFYVEGVGFKGIYRAKHSPFFDPIDIEGVPASRPFRVQIECVHHFDNPVPENALFSSTDLQRTFWLWYHNKIRRSGRGCTPLDPDARNTLIELLIRYNGGEESEKAFKREPYPNANNIQEIRSLKVSYSPKDSSISYENALEAVMMNAFRDLRSSFAPFFGNFSNIEWFANQIPYHVSGKTIDMMLYHRSQEFLGIDTRYQYTVIELKRGMADIKAVKQLFEYCGWVSDHIAAGESHLVQPLIVAHSFDQAVLNLLQSDYQTVSPTFKPLKLVQYRYDHSNGLRLQDILLQAEGLNDERYQKVRSQYLRKGRRAKNLQSSVETA